LQHSIKYCKNIFQKQLTMPHSDINKEIRIHWNQDNNEIRIIRLSDGVTLKSEIIEDCDISKFINYIQTLKTQTK
jgi:hypothetical protein